MTHRRARLLLIADALFLAVMGLFGLFSDLASFNASAGPFGAMFANDPRVIGVVEAHGLALIAGLAGLAALRTSTATPRHWHAHFAAVHLLLGGANLAFFQVFVMIGGTTGGIAVTAVHFAFAAAQLACLVRHRAPSV